MKTTNLFKTKGVFIFVILWTCFGVLKSQNDVMMQAFYWNLPADEVNKNGTWWDNLNNKADELKAAGITGIWIPSPSKGNWGIQDMGYGIYDHYDLGNYDQKGTTETKFGSRGELESMISKMHATTGGKPRINVYADIVLNHMYGSDENTQINPAVKNYVFDEAIRGTTQYVPYPTNEITWVIPNAGTGDYYIKIKGYHLNFAAGHTERAYDCQINWTNDTWLDTYNWESEPNNGGGSTNNFGPSGSSMRGFINSEGDIDEYKITLNSQHDIVIKLTARKQEDGEWKWADQVNGYYPFEIWYNGQNLASTSLNAHTNTNIGYVNHTGPGEANYSWSYTDFHPVDDNDFLTGWDWYGTDAIIPNTKGFGNDFNTFSPLVQQRLKDWGYWLANQIDFDGFRLDFVRGIQTDFVSDWINNLPPLNGEQRYIVGEYWGVDYRIKNWVDALATDGAEADGFDFPLKSTLTGMCNGNSGFDMAWLNHAGMVRNDQGNGLPGTSVVTWLDNHDTGKEHDKWITKDWKMGYAYILTHEGRPCIFYPHFYGVTLKDTHDESITVSIPGNLKDDIKKLMFIRKTYLGGGLNVLTESGNPWPSGNTNDVYVARRHGNGTKDGAIVVINNSYSTKGAWVDASPAGFSDWKNKILKDAISGTTTSVYGDGRVWVSAPARGYSVYVLSSDHVSYSNKSTNEKVESLTSDLEFEVNIYPNPAKSTSLVELKTTQNGHVIIQLFDTSGRLVSEINKGMLQSGTHEFSLAQYNLSGGNYFLKVSAEGNTVVKQFAVAK